MLCLVVWDQCLRFSAWGLGLGRLGDFGGQFWEGFKTLNPKPHAPASGSMGDE